MRYLWQILLSRSASDPESPRAYGMRRHLARACNVKLTSDLYERVCDLGLTPPLDCERRRRLSAIRRAGILFIHVPKNAGMSISRALYGREVKHSTIRYFLRVAPELVSTFPSFAVVRDPIERFLSAYRYGLKGGSGDNLVSLPFRSTYRGFGSVDDALDHLEQARFPYEVDHIYRPQCWYIMDSNGSVVVRDLLLWPEIDGYVMQRTSRPLERLNEGAGGDERLSTVQVDRLRRLYRSDFDLFEALCGDRGLRVSARVPRLAK